jgi:hypothetical protein
LKRFLLCSANVLENVGLGLSLNGCCTARCQDAPDVSLILPVSETQESGGDMLVLGRPGVQRGYFNVAAMAAIRGQA